MTYSTKSFESSYMFYFPKFENPDYILEACQPEGKDVLAIAGFGYPFHFLNAGAKVIGIDISRRQVLWNRFIAEVMTLPYQYAKAVLKAGYMPDVNLGENDNTEILYIMNGFRRRSGRLSKLEVDLIDRSYNFILDRDAFERTKIRLPDLALENKELLEFLSRSPSDSFDAIYISSVRQWVRNTFRGQTEREQLERFADQYDRHLARHIKRTLRRGGIVYEADVNTEKFKTMPISEFAYWELETKKSERKPPEGFYESRLGDFKFSWTIGVK